MTRRNEARGVAAAALLVGLLLTSGCSTTPSGSTGASGTGSAAVAAAPGVTKDSISLGVLTDLSGTFAPQGKLFSNAFGVYWDTVNRSGGVCDRTVRLVVQDHGYQPQKAVTLYQQMKPQVLAMQQVLGSPINAALLSQYTTDQMLALPAAYSSELLANEDIVMVNATYDYQTIAGLGWMIDQGMVKSGDKVGHIYFQGDYGANALRGSQHVAGKQGLTIAPIQITPAQTDLTAQVGNLKNQGVAAILLSVGPRQTASAAAADATSGLNVPLFGNDPTFIPQLLKTPAGPALIKNFYTVFAAAPPTDPALQEYSTAYQQKYPNEPLDFTASNAFASGDVMRRLLDTACKQGEPTRPSLHAAFRSLSDLDTGGVMPPLDFSKPGASPTIQVRVYRPDAAASSGLKAVTELISGKDAATYTPPAQQ